MEKVTITMSINFRLPIENEKPNYMGWFDNDKQNFTIYAENKKQMNQLLYPKTVDELEKDGKGKMCKIIYENNGIPVINENMDKE